MGLAPVITAETAGFGRVRSVISSQAGHMAGWDAESWERGLKEAHKSSILFLVLWTRAGDLKYLKRSVDRVDPAAVAACLVPVLTWTILDCFSLLNIPIMLKISKDCESKYFVHVWLPCCCCCIITQLSTHSLTETRPCDVFFRLPAADVRLRPRSDDLASPWRYNKEICYRMLKLAHALYNLTAP